MQGRLWLYLQTRHNSHDDKPEPQKDVDLLIDNVQGKDTETIKLGEGIG